MRSSRWLLLAVLGAASCGGKPAPQSPKPQQLPGPIGLGEQIKSDLRTQNDEAKARRQAAEDAVQGK
jgi:hypothetical protein